MLSEKEKKLRQHNKELSSFRNRMGKHIVWFDALASDKQYDLLFLWKKEKMNKKNITKPTEVKYKYGNRYKLTNLTYTVYPASLKHFLEEHKLDRRFQPNKARIREASLNLLLKDELH